MSDSFAIVSVHGGRQLLFRGSIPRGLAGYDGCTFTARLVGPAVEAAVDVYDNQAAAVVRAVSRFGEGLARLVGREG